MIQVLLKCKKNISYVYNTIALESIRVFDRSSDFLIDNNEQFPSKILFSFSENTDLISDINQSNG